MREEKLTSVEQIKEWMASMGSPSKSIHCSGTNIDLHEFMTWSAPITITSKKLPTKKELVKKAYQAIEQDLFL